MAVKRTLPILLVCVALLIVPRLLYTGAGAHLRLLDEHELVWENAAVNGGDIAQTLQGRWQAGEFRPQFRPAATLFRAAEHALFGFDRSRFQLDQILLHGINAILLFLLLRRWTRSLSAAGLGAAFFAVHPVSTHSILYLGGLSEILATGFILATLLAYREGEWSGPGGAVAVGAFSFLAMTSKEIGFLLPILVLGTGVIYRERKRPAIRTAMPVLIALATAVMLRWLAFATTPEAIRRIPAVDAATGEPALGLLLRAFAGIAVELSVLIAPLRMSPDYSWLIVLGSAVVSVLAVVGLGAVVVGLAAAFRAGEGPGRSMSLAVAALGLLLPAVAVLSAGTVASERNLYPVLVGWSGLLATAGVAIARRRASIAPVLGGVAAGLVILYGVGTMVRVPAYKDDTTLMESARRSYPGNPAVYYYLGNERLSKADYAGARTYYEEAIRRRPTFLLGSLNLATALIGQEEYGLALRVLDPLAQRAKHNRALRLIDAKAHYHAGLVLMQQDRFKEAAEAFERTLLFYPDHIGARGNLGLIYVKAPVYAERGIPLLTETLAREMDPKRRAALERALKTAQEYLKDYIEQTGELPSKRESPQNAPLGEPWKTAAAEGM